jgi:hypothetical protein
VALVNVAAGDVCTCILVEVGAEVANLGTVPTRLIGIILIDLLLNGREVAAHRSIRLTAEESIRRLERGE